MANDIKTEATNLLKEIKILQQKNEDLKAEIEDLKQIKSSPTDQNSKVQNVNVNDIESPLPTASSFKSKVEDIVITQERIDQYQTSMSDFFNAAEYFFFF